MNNKKDLESELIEFNKILKEKNSNLKEFDYFLNLNNLENTFSLAQHKSRVIMISHYYPDEIIRAMNLTPCYIFGGNYQSSKFNNLNLPNDSNDQIKSIIGILKSDVLNITKNDVLIVPYSNDSFKVIKMLLEEKTTIIGFDMPFNITNELSRKAFYREIVRVKNELSKHFHKHLNKQSLRKEILISKLAAQNWEKLEKLFLNNKTQLSFSGFMFLLNSYYLTKDKVEWSRHIDALYNEMKENAKEYTNNNQVLLMGSPIYTPNFKIIFEMENLQFNVKQILHPDAFEIKKYLGINNSISSIKSLASIYLNIFKDIELFEKLVKESNVNGIIFYIIKGQMQYDYAHKIVEKLVSKYKIPIVEINTMYSYQDISQIKLKLEAFKEILNQNNEIKNNSY